MPQKATLNFETCKLPCPYYKMALRAFYRLLGGYTKITLTGYPMAEKK